jgi:hypothetical protein
MALITLEEAKAHLGLDGFNDRDATVTQKIEEASVIVLRHIKATDAAWTPETAPADIKAATKFVLYDLYYHLEGSENGDAVLSRTVVEILRFHRMPSIA